MTKQSALSDLQIKKAPIGSKKYRITDGEGLSIVISPTGKKFWQFLFRGNTISLGQYPRVGLKEAREKRDHVKEAVRAGADPVRLARIAKAQVLVAHAEAKAAEEGALTVRQVWELYNKKVEASVSERQRDKNTSRLERHVFPKIGNSRARDLTPLRCMVLIESIMEEKDSYSLEGKFHTADRCRSMMSRAFGLASVLGKVPTNPWANVKLGMIGKPRTEGRLAVPVQFLPELAYDVLTANLEGRAKQGGTDACPGAAVHFFNVGTQPRDPQRPVGPV